MAVSLVPWLVTVRLVAFCPGERKMLTGTTDNACPLDTAVTKRAKETAENAWPAAVIRNEFHEIIKA
jgi:hypothetical protein